MKLEDIEKAVAELPADELAEFRRWFHAFDAEQWDRQFEQDVRERKARPLRGRGDRGLRGRAREEAVKHFTRRPASGRPMT